MRLPHFFRKVFDDGSQIESQQKRGSTDSKSRPLVVVDVGCRWGFAERFVSPENLGKFQVIGFDPDPHECKRLQDLYKDIPSGVIQCVPLALAGECGERELYVTKEPACSSLHKPIRYLSHHYPALECIKIDRKINIDVVTMKSWADEQFIEEIDYIKIDTQGSELEILKGFEGLLDSTRCIDIEVEFNPIYEGQSLFGETDSYLRSKGFMLWRLSNLVHYSLDEEAVPLQESNYIHFDNKYRHETEAYGGQLFWADARYVHSDIIKNCHKDSEKTSRDITLLNALGMQDVISHLNKVMHSK